MRLGKLLSYLAGPITIGLLSAVALLLGLHFWHDDYQIVLPSLSKVEKPSAPTQNSANAGASDFNGSAATPANLNGFAGVVSYAAAVNKAAPSVVNVFTQAVINEPSRIDRYYSRSQSFNRYAPVSRQRVQRSLGSGVIITEDGYIVTNYHVVGGATTIAVSLNDGRIGEAKVVGYDEEFDLAVIKIDLGDLNPITTIRKSDDLEVGDIVLAIGNPFGVRHTVTQGIISATGRVDQQYNSYIQTDAAINPGNSGGALIDAYGNLVGINSAQISIADENPIGIGFAIPAEVAVKVFSELKDFGRVIRGWLGVGGDQVTQAIATQLNMDFVGGFLVGLINPESPAEMAGLKLGDVITHINNQPITNMQLLSAQIERTPPGEQVNITIWRLGELKELQATIGERPDTSP